MSTEISFQKSLAKEKAMKYEASSRPSTKSGKENDPIERQLKELILEENILLGTFFFFFKQKS